MAHLGPDDFIMYCLKITTPADLPRPSQPYVVDVDVLYDPSGGVADADLKYRFGTDGNPTNDTDPVGNTMDDTVDVDPDVAGNCISALTIVGTSQSYRGIAGRQNKHATGEFQNAKVTNRAGANPPAGTGVFSVYSTSASDTDDLHLIFKSSSTWTEEDVTLNGVTPVISSDSCDTASDFIALYNNGAIPIGDIYGEVDGEIVFVIYGSNSGYGNYMAGTLAQIALATAQNANLSATNRKTDPASGMGSYSRATYWPGNDSAIAVP